MCSEGMNEHIKCELAKNNIFWGFVFFWGGGGGGGGGGGAAS